MQLFKLKNRYRVEYKPGWDCHGIPIELKALESITSNSTSKLNSKSQETSQEVVADSSLHAEEIVTKENQPEINNDEISKD